MSPRKHPLLTWAPKPSSTHVSIIKDWIEWLRSTPNTGSVKERKKRLEVSGVPNVRSPLYESNLHACCKDFVYQIMCDRFKDDIVVVLEEKATLRSL